MPETAFVLEGVFFEDLLAQAGDSPTNEEAQNALQGFISEVIANGDMERTMALSMILGAATCAHPHLEGMTSTFNDFVTAESDERIRERSGSKAAGFLVTKTKKKRKTKGRASWLPVTKKAGSFALQPLFPVLRKII